MKIKIIKDTTGLKQIVGKPLGKAMKIKIKDTTELRAFIEKALPNYSVTHLAKHLRKIKDDPATNFKNLIIWYGCPRITELIELRVTTALHVTSVDGFNGDIAQATQDELQKAWDKNCKRIEKNNEKRLAKLAEADAKAKRNEKRRLQRKLNKGIPSEKIKVNIEDPLEVPVDTLAQVTHFEQPSQPVEA